MFPKKRTQKNGQEESQFLAAICEMIRRFSI